MTTSSFYTFLLWLTGAPAALGLLATLVLLALTRFLALLLGVMTPNPAAAQAQAGRRVTGYFAGWSVYAAHHDYRVAKIPFQDLTHVNGAFAGIERASGGTYRLVQLDPWADEQNTFGVVPWGSPYAGNLGQLMFYRERHDRRQVL
jgi:GH18 family chitinase